MKKCRLSKNAKTNLNNQWITGNLIGLRLEKGLTQNEIAKRLGVSRSAYTYYETGRSEPSISSLIKLSDFYEVSIDEIIKGRI